MTYDPREDPRWLGQEPQVDPQLLEQVALLPKVREALEVFDSPGWQAIEEILGARLREAEILALASKSMDELAEYRGKIRAFRTFLSIKPSLQIEQERLREIAMDVAETTEGG